MARTKASFWSKSLDKLRSALPHAEPEPATRPTKKKAEQSKPEQKKPEQKKAEQKKPAQPARPATATADSSASPDATTANPQTEKAPKKLPAQPWYRHRQRW